MCINGYILQYVSAEACDVSRVMAYSVLNECSVLLLWWTVASLHLPVGHLAHGQEQIKDLFHLLRILEVGIVEYKICRGNSYANLCYMFLLACCRKYVL